MKFSEALLLGLPEIHLTNLRWLEHRNLLEEELVARIQMEPNTVGVGSKECVGCFVGAALYAVGERGQEHMDGTGVIGVLRQHWPKLAAKRFPSRCPFCEGYAQWHGLGVDITMLCTHLVKHYQEKQITAQQAADYVAQFEPEEDVPVSEEKKESTVEVVA